MSHYAVGVIHRPYQDIEELLARYSENLEVDDYIAETKNELIQNARNNILRAKKLYEEGNHYNPKYYEEEMLPYAEDAEKNNEDKLFEFATRYLEPDTLDEDGNRHSTYNPDSKWDWYVEGGRFCDYIPTKSGEFATEAAVSDIDFSDNTDDYNNALKCWEFYVEEKPLPEGEEAPFMFYKKEYYLDRYKTKERYAHEQSSFYTYALVTPDGEWHEPGPMGWFGMSAASNEDEWSWADNFESLVSQYPDCVMTIVDCHI